MIKFCVRKWDENKEVLREALAEMTNDIDYLSLVKAVTKYIYEYDDEAVTEIDNGDYQGTLLYAIAPKTYQPSAGDYLMTYVYYGSCSGCDTMQSIIDWSDNILSQSQVDDLMLLAKDIVQSTIKPFNYGWRNDDDFETIDKI